MSYSLDMKDSYLELFTCDALAVLQLTTQYSMERLNLKITTTVNHGTASTPPVSGINLPISALLLITLLNINLLVNYLTRHPLSSRDRCEMRNLEYLDLDLCNCEFYAVKTIHSAQFLINRDFPEFLKLWCFGFVAGTLADRVIQSGQSFISLGFCDFL
jgi:hypothetical protein